MKNLLLLFVVLLAIIAGNALNADAAESKIKVLIVTGGHGFKRESFFKIFSDNPSISFAEAEHKKDADAYDDEDLLSHDVIVLYDMPKTITESQKAKFVSLVNKGVGLVVLHHALASYQHWPDYERIIGGRYPEEDGKSGVVTPRVGYEHDVEVPIVILAKHHPITASVSDFQIHDEIYWGFRVSSDVTPLITTTHSKSGKPLAWAREEGKSRVVYIQLGHGPEAYENPNYRRLIAQSIRWAARR